MERFGLTRLDLMRMSWTEVSMMFDATYVDEASEKVEEARYATQEDLMSWI